MISSLHGCLAWIIHEYGEIWVEQGFSPAFTARLGLAALALRYILSATAESPQGLKPAWLLAFLQA